MTDEYNAYTEEILKKGDMLVDLLQAGEDFKSGKINKLEYYDRMKTIIDGIGQIGFDTGLN